MVKGFALLVMRLMLGLVLLIAVLTGMVSSSATLDLLAPYHEAYFTTETLARFVYGFTLFAIACVLIGFLRVLFLLLVTLIAAGAMGMAWLSAWDLTAFGLSLAEVGVFLPAILSTLLFSVALLLLADRKADVMSLDYRLFQYVPPVKAGPVPKAAEGDGEDDFDAQREDLPVTEIWEPTEEERAALSEAAGKFDPVEAMQDDVPAAPPGLAFADSHAASEVVADIQRVLNMHGAQQDIAQRREAAAHATADEGEGDDLDEEDSAVDLHDASPEETYGEGSGSGANEQTPLRALVTALVGAGLTAPAVVPAIQALLEERQDAQDGADWLAKGDGVLDRLVPQADAVQRQDIDELLTGLGGWLQANGLTTSEIVAGLGASVNNILTELLEFLPAAEYAPSSESAEAGTSDNGGSDGGGAGDGGGGGGGD